MEVVNQMQAAIDSKPLGSDKTKTYLIRPTSKTKDNIKGFMLAR